MNDMRLYEFIPEKKFPIILHDYQKERYVFHAHWHENIEVHYLFEGEGDLRCQGEELHLSAGDCAVINGNELHQGYAGKCSYACIIFPVSFLGEERVLFRSMIRADEIGRIFTRMYEAFRKKEPGYELLIKSETYALLAYLVRHDVKERLSERRYESRFEALEKINEAARYLEEHFTEEITTHALARTANLSEGYFCNLFKRVTGKTAKEYVIALRLKQAEELLSSTDMTVTEIAFCCGFQDANYFTRMFKKGIGMSPRKFRTAKRK